MKKQDSTSSFGEGDFALQLNDATYSVVVYKVDQNLSLKAVVGPDFFEATRMSASILTLDLRSTIAAHFFEAIVAESDRDASWLRQKTIRTANINLLADAILADESSLSFATLGSSTTQERFAAILAGLYDQPRLLNGAKPSFQALLEATKSTKVEVAKQDEQLESSREGSDEPGSDAESPAEGEAGAALAEAPAEENREPAPPAFDELVSSELSGCYMKLDVCERRPSRVGYFLDRKRGTAEDQSACLQRAYQYQRWCRNSAEDFVVAEFHRDGYLLASVRSDVPYDGCIISMDSCQRKPDRIGWFVDNHQGASSDMNRCLKRSLEYHRWCKNRPDELVTASYYEDGDMLATIHSQQPYDGCIIQQTRCERHPDRVGLFLDGHRGAGTDAKLCLRRAMDYRKWCRNSAEDVTVASFYENGQLIQQVDSQTPYHGCIIQQQVCQRDETRTGMFVDNYRQSSSDPDRCMQRAMEFKNWCRNSSDQVTTASYYEFGELIKTNDSNKPYQGCHIEMDACVKHPDRQGLFLDRRRQASESKSACLRRSLEYHRWCGNSRDQVVTASFYEKGVMQASINSQSPYHGCVIEQDVCERRPQKVGLFIDPLRDSQVDASVCLSRAEQFSKWCRNKQASTVAHYYEDGKKIDSLTFTP